MITYVINTSGNQIFNGELLFNLAGYSNMVWIGTSLEEIESCADEIFERQNRMLDDGQYRIAVIVDFYNYELILQSQEATWQEREKTVSAPTYYPFLEAYLDLHLFHNLRKKFQGQGPARQEVYYIQGRGERLDGGDTAQHLYAARIFGATEGMDQKEQEYASLLWQSEEETPVAPVPSKGKSKKEDKNDKKIENPDELRPVGSFEDEDGTLHFRFLLKTQTGAKPLVFDIDDYSPGYGKSYQRRIDDWKARIEASRREREEQERLEAERKEKEEREKEENPDAKPASKKKTPVVPILLGTLPEDEPAPDPFSDFVRAIRNSESGARHIHRIIYHSSGVGTARATFDALNLSLYLIYKAQNDDLSSDIDREESASGIDDRLNRVKPKDLKDILMNALRRIEQVRLQALNENSYYFRLDIEPSGNKTQSVESRESAPPPDEGERWKPDKEDMAKGPDGWYDRICAFAEHTNTRELQERDSVAFDAIFDEYLTRRDQDNESSLEMHYAELESLGKLKKSPNLPTLENLDGAVSSREKEISRRLEKALSNEAISVDYQAIKTKADVSYERYCKAKAMLKGNVLAEIFLGLLTILCMVVPFITMQNRGNVSIGMWIGCFVTAGITAGLFLLAFFCSILPQRMIMNGEKSRLLEYLIECEQKSRKGQRALAQRYREELPGIEELRYEIREIYGLWRQNGAIDRNVRLHKEMLESVRDQLRGLLNRLGYSIEEFRPDAQAEDFSHMIHVDLAPEHPSNTVYQVFTSEILNSLFSGKGGLLS